MLARIAFSLLILLSLKSFAQDPRSFPTTETKAAALVQVLMSAEFRDGQPLQSENWKLVTQLMSEGFLNHEIWNEIYRTYSQNESGALRERLIILQQGSMYSQEMFALVPENSEAPSVQKSFRTLMASNFVVFEISYRTEIYLLYYEHQTLSKLEPENFIPIVGGFNEDRVMFAQAWRKVVVELKVLSEVSPELYDRYITELAKPQFLRKLTTAQRAEVPALNAVPTERLAFRVARACYKFIKGWW